MIVVDTNIVAYLLIPGQFSAAAKNLIVRDDDWIAPQLWRSEFRNVVANYVRNKYMDLSQALFLTDKAEILMKGREYFVHSNAILELSAISGCSAYDCEFVALAKDKNLTLVTTDKDLIRAFPKIARHLIEFSKQK